MDGNQHRKLDHHHEFRHRQRHGELHGGGQHQHDLAHRHHHRGRADVHRDAGRGGGVQLLDFPHQLQHGGARRLQQLRGDGGQRLLVDPVGEFERGIVAASGIDCFRHGEWIGELLGRSEYIDDLAHRHHRGCQPDVHRDAGRGRLGHRAEHRAGRHCERGQQPGRRHRARLHVHHLRDQPGTGRILVGVPIPDPQAR